MNSSERWIGIDLGKWSYELKYFLADGSVSGWGGKTTVEGRKALYSRLKKTDKVAMEVCSLAFVLAKEMNREVGCKVLLLHPGKLAVIYKSTKKTDKEDALKLARLIKTYNEKDLPTVTLPTEQEDRRRRMLTEIRQCKQDRTKEINRLHALFVSTGHTEMVRKDLATRENREKVCTALTGYEAASCRRLLRRLNLLEDQIEELNQLVSKEVKNDTVIEHLQTVPGIGVMTAMAFNAFIGDGSRFDRASQVSATIGLVPRIDISCSIVHIGGITKRGPSYLRSLLVMAAWSLVRSKKESPLKTKYEYMVKIQSKNKKKAIVAVARKLAELLFTLTRQGEIYKPLTADGRKQLVNEALSA